MNRNTILKHITAARQANERPSFKGIDLSKAYLPQIDLESSDLCQANLSQANLYQANLHDANLEGANLHRANLQEANLSNANLYQADLRDADLRQAILDQADLRQAKLDGAKFDEPALSWAYLNDEDLLDHRHEEELSHEEEVYHEEPVEIGESPSIEETLETALPNVEETLRNLNNNKEEPKHSSIRSFFYISLSVLAGGGAISQYAPDSSWLLFAVAILFMAIFVSIELANRYHEDELTKGKILAYRLKPSWGQPKPFLLGCGLPGLVTLSAFLFTLIMAIPVVSPDGLLLMLMIPALVCYAIILRETVKSIYLIAGKSSTIVEISTYPLKPNDSVLLYVSHQSGNFAVQSLIVKIICQETTQVKDIDGEDKYDVKTIYEKSYNVKYFISKSSLKVWEETLELPIPPDAKASVGDPPIKWQIEVKLIINHTPNVTMTYPLKVITG